MPYIGNDVVDLASPENAQKSTDLRFLKKILTDNEIGQIRSSGDPDRILWSLWAAKEAAYKVFMKQTGDVSFVPRRWSVCLRAPVMSAEAREGLSSVETSGDVMIAGTKKIFFSLFPSDTHIHCLATDQAESLRRAVWRVEELPSGQETDPSVFVRSCLINDLSAHLRVEKARLDVRRDRTGGKAPGPPVVYLDKTKADVDISLSHDGRLVAFAYLA